jgi:hypothetical protein
MKLVVTHPFATYKAGDEITDKATVEKILNSEQAQYVVKVALPKAAK